MVSYYYNTWNRILNQLFTISVLTKKYVCIFNLNDAGQYVAEKIFLWWGDHEILYSKPPSKELSAGSVVGLTAFSSHPHLMSQCGQPRPCLPAAPHTQRVRLEVL